LVGCLLPWLGYLTKAAGLRFNTLPTLPEPTQGGPQHNTAASAINDGM